MSKKIYKSAKAKRDANNRRRRDKRAAERERRAAEESDRAFMGERRRPSPDWKKTTEEMAGRVGRNMGARLADPVRATLKQDDVALAAVEVTAEEFVAMLSEGIARARRIEMADALSQPRPMSADQQPQAEEAKVAVDEVYNPPHYTRLNPQPLNIVEAWGMDFHSGSAIEYIARHEAKGNPIGDLKKAVNLLNRRIALLEKARK